MTENDLESVGFHARIEITLEHIHARLSNIESTLHDFGATGADYRSRIEQLEYKSNTSGRAFWIAITAMAAAIAKIATDWFRGP